MGAWSDPQAEETFRACKLRWESLGRAPHADMLAFYRALIALRRRLAPLRNGRKDLTRVEHDEAARWLTHPARRRERRRDVHVRQPRRRAGAHPRPRRDVAAGARDGAVDRQRGGRRQRGSATLALPPSTGGTIYVVPPLDRRDRRTVPGRRLVEARRAGARIGAEHDALAAVPAPVAAARAERALRARSEDHRQRHRRHHRQHDHHPPSAD